MSDPDKGPWAGMAMGLHNHVPDAPCDDTCTEYPASPKHHTVGPIPAVASMTANGGWCAPLNYDFITTPDERTAQEQREAVLRVRRTLPWRTRVRIWFRELRSRFRAAYGAFRAPDEWWDR